MNVYPIFLTDLQSRRCLVIGGDSEAERKVEGLLAANASVTVISETLTDNMTLWANQHRIAWLPRAWQPGDMEGVWLAIATTRDCALATRLKDEAEQHGVLLNVTDDVPHSNFVAGSVMRRGPLAIAVSTSGCSPALAARIRQQMEQRFGPEYADFLDLLGELRQPVSARYPSPQARKAALDATTGFRHARSAAKGPARAGPPPGFPAGWIDECRNPTGAGSGALT